MAEREDAARRGALAPFAFGALSVLVGSYLAWRLGERGRPDEADELDEAPANRTRARRRA